ncbi:MAG: RluA family pseudouridine synthase [Firmicutes bacterium]|nr:RluA family pseudouridine synthase [Bacillota bacterium]
MEILFEDNHIIVTVKPQNMPSQGDESGDQSLLDAVKEYIGQKYNKPGNVYIGLVHRLDRPTGGVMVFARTSKAASRLGAQIKDGDFEKKYFAVVSGMPKEKRGTLVNYLVKNEATNMVSVTGAAVLGAKRAELTYNIVEQGEKYSLASIQLLTGRGHQARVQMQYLGNPIYGDARYGGSPGKNLALWAYELRFRHPITDTAMTFRAAPPVSEVPWSEFKNIEHIINTL